MPISCIVDAHVMWSTAKPLLSAGSYISRRALSLDDRVECGETVTLNKQLVVTFLCCFDTFIQTTSSPCSILSLKRSLHFVAHSKYHRFIDVH